MVTRILIKWKGERSPMSHGEASPVSVLYVDDEPEFAELVATQLERDDPSFSVDVETTAPEALERLRAGDPGVDCVVSDYEMPEMDGLELLEAVRDDWPDLPFVLFTGRGSENIASEAISRGVTEYMQKATDPQQFEVLANRVTNAVEKYQTERQLARTKTRYRRLVEQNLTGIYIIQDGDIQYANPKCGDIFGYSTDELESMSAFELAAEEDHDTIRENMAKVERGELEELKHTFAGIRANGERFEFEVHSGRIDYEGEPALLGSLVDVTEQREREREFEEYRELVETVGDPMYVLDEDGYIVKANRAMAEMMGVEPGEMEGTDTREYLVGEDVERAQSLVEGFLEGTVDPPQTIEVSFRTADGTVPCEANVTKLTDEDGSFRGTVGVVRVIADRKERERELEGYETIVETAPDGIFILDDEGYFVSGNTTGAEMIGMDREDILGSHFSELVETGVLEQGLAERYANLVQELVSGDTERNKAKFETTLEPADGGERTCEIHIAVLPDGDGTLRGTVGVVRDITERKAIEEALRSERDRLSALFENIPEPTVVYEYVDGTPLIRQVNDAFEETFGFDESAVLGDSIDQYIVPPGEAEQAGELNGRVVAGEQLDVEIQRRTADGEVRDFLLRNAPIPTEQGTQGYAIYTDITERRESQQRVQALFEHSTDCIVETEYAEGEPVVRRVNEAFETTFGFDQADVVGSSLDDFIVPPGRQEEADRINESIDGGSPTEAEVTRVTAEGKREFLHRSIPFHVEGQTWTYAVYTDITERMEREQRLEALHTATRDLMEATSSEEVFDIGIEAAERVLGLAIAGFFGHDEDRDALVPRAATDRARTLFDGIPTFDRGEGVAWEVFESGTPTVADDVRRLDAVYNPETPIRSEMILPVGDHGLFMAAAEEAGTFDQAEEFLAQVLVSNVETALERARRESLLREREQTLLRQNERLEEFAGVVSHDLRSPLTVAKGNAYLARTDGDQEYVEKIEAALDRMEQLIDDLLTLAREGETVDEVEAVDMAATVREAWSTVGTGTADLALPADGRVLAADEGRLRELLENLFGNAVEHGGDDVTVTVGVLGDGFYVADDGEGLDEEARANLFEPGFTTDDEGTGFGLSIVRQIAEAHGWEVAATESDAGGARFEFTGVQISEPDQPRP
jgi:PAS domain S-box-containing protein